MLCFLGHACGYTHSVPKYKPFRDSMQFINYNFSDVSSFSFAVQFFLRAMVLWFCLYLMPFSMFFLLIFRTNPTRYILLVTLLAGSIYCWIYIVGHFACWIDQYIAGYISHLAAARWSMQEKKCYLAYKPSVPGTWHPAYRHIMPRGAV